MKKIILTLIYLFSVSAPSFAQILGINFNADTDRRGQVMLSTSTAGAPGEAISNWNNVAYGDGSVDPTFSNNGSTFSWQVANPIDGTNNLLTSTGIESGVSITAITTNTGGGPDGLWGQGLDTSTGDNRLFSGGLQIRSATVNVDLNNLSGFAPNGFTAYIYFSAGTTGILDITDGTSTISGFSPTDFSGTYVDGTTSLSGNYIKLSELATNSLNFTINRDPSSPTDAFTNVAGIELVAAVPEPSTCTMLALGMLFLILCNNRRRFYFLHL